MSHFHSRISRLFTLDFVYICCVLFSKKIFVFDKNRSEFLLHGSESFGRSYSMLKLKFPLVDIKKVNHQLKKKLKISLCFTHQKLTFQLDFEHLSAYWDLEHSQNFFVFQKIEADYCDIILKFLEGPNQLSNFIFH